MADRLQKVLANLGLGSRREIEDWIRSGRIHVNGELATLGMQVEGNEALLLDGKPIKLFDRPFRRRVLMYFKPVGEMTTRDDPEGRRTIFESLPRINQGRWISVGRLDLNTQGLLLVTNDGELAHKLMHPSSEIEREYAVRVLGEVTEEMLKNLKKGVELEDGVSKFDEIIAAGGEGANSWYHVILRGGKNREVRRLWESQGLTVSRLIRVRYGSVSLPRGLKPGKFDDVDEESLKALLAMVGLQHQSAEAYKKENFGGHGKDHSFERSKHNERPRREGDRPSFGSERPRREGDRPSFGSERPRREGDRPSFGSERPRREGDRPSFGSERPRREGDRPSFGSERPRRDGDRPSFGSERPRREGDRPSFGSERPRREGDRPSFGSDRPKRRDR